jgi:hypothetical protein
VLWHHPGIAAAGTAVARTNYDGNWSVLACERDERRRTMRSLHIPRVTTVAIGLLLGVGAETMIEYLLHSLLK